MESENKSKHSPRNKTRDFHTIIDQVTMIFIHPPPALALTLRLPTSSMNFIKSAGFKSLVAEPFPFVVAVVAVALTPFPLTCCCCCCSDMFTVIDLTM